eukprot:12407115-Alexandrium_andersonii.AAC.1
MRTGRLLRTSAMMCGRRRLLPEVDEAGMMPEDGELPGLTSPRLVTGHRSQEVRPLVTPGLASSIG